MASTAAAADSAQEFMGNLFTGALGGDMLSIAIIGVAVVIVARFLFARWLYLILSQVFIFGMLGLAVWNISGAVGDRWGETAQRIVLYGGGGVVLILFVVMLTIFIGNRRRERALKPAAPGQAKHAPAARLQHRPARAPPRMVAQPGQQTPMGTPRPDTRRAAAQPAGVPPPEDETKIHEMLRKMNILGASKDQNLLTVFVLIVIAEFGVFTSRTVAPPSWQVGASLFAIFFLAAIIFIRSSYKNYMKGLSHLLVAGIIAVLLSLGLLMFYSSAQVCHDPAPGQNATAPNGEVLRDCASAGPITSTWALNPFNYFASDAVVAAITGVAFSILLSKGGGS